MNQPLKAPWFQSFFQPLEVVLSTYKTIIFLGAYVIFAGLWIGGLLEEWYEFIALMSTMALGVLISRVNYLKFYGLEVATDQYMQLIQAQVVHRQLFPELYPLPAPVAPSLPQAEE